MIYDRICKLSRLDGMYFLEIVSILQDMANSRIKGFYVNYTIDYDKEHER
jgi:hypothetical protein